MQSTNNQYQEEKMIVIITFIHLVGYQKKQDYSLSARVEDTAGNFFQTAPHVVNIEEFVGSGISADVLGDNNFTCEVGSQILIPVNTTSEYDIGTVQFFLNMEPIGEADIVDGSQYGKIIDFSGPEITQGIHTLSYYAVDKLGNQSGTHRSLSPI